ncbi:MAG: RHS repeat-associated core domain-containing protein [Chitinophagaceae bacterium]
MMISSAIKKALLVLVMVCSSAVAAMAASESYIQTLTGKIKKGDSCTVIDDKFLNMPLIDWNQVRNLSVNNIVTFELRFDTSIFYASRSFTCSLNVSIKYFTSRDQQTPEEINNVDLIVKYDTAKGAAYAAYATYKFKNAFKVIVVVNSITSPEWGSNIPAVFRLKNQVLVERKYPFNTEVDGGMHLNLQGGTSSGQAAARLSVNTAVSTAANGEHLDINWNSADFPGAEEYDLEWTYIDSKSKRGLDVLLNYRAGSAFDIPDAIAEQWMRNDNTRVTVKGTSYSINLPYTDGYILVRVRGVSYDDNLRITTNWIYRNDDDQTACVEIGSHEEGLNWQYTASFTEEGKRKEVISYFDATLRSRQGVTLSNSDLTWDDNDDDKQPTSIVQETIYDKMGRPAINVLPAPVNKNTLHYFPAFNRNTAGDAYSHNDIALDAGGTNNCFIGAYPMANTSGAAQYYSANNKFIQASSNNKNDFYFTKYVPDAGGYPYSLTEYTPDNTGRIRRQGGVGPEFQIGKANDFQTNTKHETTYYYGKPGQKELDRLFGSEVGDASHYLKNVVIDANGQASVSYIDANGKTIATALAGLSPDNLQGLPSSGNVAKTTFNQSLIKQTDFISNAGSLLTQSSATFLATTENVNYQLHYSVNPAVLTTSPLQSAQFCSNCSYEMLVEVKNDCGELVASSTSTAFTVNDASCNEKNPVTGTITVPIARRGEYNVLYTLRLSQSVINYQEDYYISHNTDLKQLWQFFKEELDQLDLSGCYSTCEECKLLGSTSDDFRARIIALLGESKFNNILQNTSFSGQFEIWITDTWTALKAKCATISCNATSACDDYLLIMKEDVKPGGQYALYNATEAENEEDVVYTLVEDNINVLRFYNLNQAGNEEIYNFSYTDENGATVFIRNLSLKAFIKAYQLHPEWADMFVKKHIEYCSYLWCKDQSYTPSVNNNEASYTFDKTLRENVTTGEDAVNLGYMNSSDPDALLNADPFFNGGRGTGAMKTSMHNDLANFSTVMGFNMQDASGNPMAVKNIIQLIQWMLYCKPDNAGATATDFVNSWNCTVSEGCRSLGREWELYRNYYLQQKVKYMQQAKAASNPECVNCFVGRDVLAQGECEPVLPGDYKSVIEPANSVDPAKAYIVYIDGSVPFPAGMRAFYKITYTTGSPVYGNKELSQGSERLELTLDQNRALSSVTIDSVVCTKSTPVQNCSAAGTSCPGTEAFNFSYVDLPTYNMPDYYQLLRREVYYVHTSGAVTNAVTITAERRQESTFGGVTYTYPTFTIPAGQDRVYIGDEYEDWDDANANGVMEVGEIQSLSFIVLGTTCTSGYPSTCTANPLYTYYRFKNRVFNEYVDVSSYNACSAANTSAVALSEAETNARALAVYKQQAIENLDALKEAWKETLNTARQEEAVFSAITAGQVNDLADGLYKVAKANIDLATTTDAVRAASTLPVGNTVPVYATGNPTPVNCNSFSEVFTFLIGNTLMSSGFNQYLLEQPYPYDKKQVEVNPSSGELSTTICTNMYYFYSRWTSAVLTGAFVGDFYTYLKRELGDDFMLTSTQLDDLRVRCNTSCHYLKDPVPLPAAFATPWPSFVSCTTVGNLAGQFQAAYPSVPQESKLYRILFTNYLNHNLGYSLSYGEYLAFTDKCTVDNQALLYQKPASPLVMYDKFSCVADQLKGAYERAGMEYDRYIVIERKKFRNNYISKCLSAGGAASVEGDQYEYHYTLYYYDQSGNLVKTIPPEGVRFLNEDELAQLDQFRNNTAIVCDGTGIPTTEDKTGTFNGFSTALQNTTGQSAEMWLYSNNGVRQVRIITPDNKYFYQVAIANNKLWAELYSLNPVTGSSGNEIEITLTNHAVADISNIPLHAWSHVVVQANSFVAGTWDLYLDGQKLTLLSGTNAPPYPYEWEITSGYTLPAEELAQLKHFRIYNRLTTDAEVYANYQNSCLSPVGALAVQSIPLVVWGRFNIPAPGSETTTGSGSTTEYNSRFIVPKHGLPTNYAYNSQNQVIKQSSPDGGTSEFWYDRLGRLIASQNAEQKQPSNSTDAANRYSYTIYDLQGRISIVGEKTGGIDITTLDIRKGGDLTAWYNSGTNASITETIYDEAPSFAPGVLTNLRKRIAASVFRLTPDVVTNATYYLYDISGNVGTLYQEIGKLKELDPVTGVKRIDYDYDLISGKVNLVKYQEGKIDQFYYQYQYDADNRITAALTSRDKMVWNTEAAYRYYLHGPLARTELGQNRVQGLDYAYTLQGWMKGINGQELNQDKEMSQDGKAGTGFANVGRDVLGFSIGYYNNDYQPIGGSVAPAFSAVYQPSAIPNTETGNALYNGNINTTTLAIKQFDNGAVKGYSYRYDQLNRLVQMRQHNIANGSTSWNNSNIVAGDDYREAISYDANGNITDYFRNGYGANVSMDNLAYQYNKDAAGNLLNNRLRHVTDDASATNYTEDLKSQDADNYSYDKIGNLTGDKQEKLTSIKWTVYGKISSINKDTRSSGGSGLPDDGNWGTVIDINYQYDAGANRVYKETRGENFSMHTTPAEHTATFYIRDAQGAVLAVYERTWKENTISWTPGIKWKEQHLYGSSRLGMWNPTDIEVNGESFPTGGVTNSNLGERSYELSNHLGNVIAVISDDRTAVDENTDGTIDYYNAIVKNATDYYPFGMAMPGRKYNLSGYRYGFNGKENDNEIEGEGNQQDYGDRVYDTRLGRWLSVDPYRNKYPSLSPYNYVNNSPLLMIDKDGRDFGIYIDKKNGTITIRAVYYTENVEYVHNAAQAAADYLNSFSGKYKFIDEKSKQEYKINFDISVKPFVDVSKKNREEKSDIFRKDYENAVNDDEANFVASYPYTVGTTRFGRTASGGDNMILINLASFDGLTREVLTSSEAKERGINTADEFYKYVMTHEGLHALGIDHNLMSNNASVDIDIIKTILAYADKYNTNKNNKIKVAEVQKKWLLKIDKRTARNLPGYGTTEEHQPKSKIKSTEKSGAQLNGKIVESK